jgi:hypothetical protein
MIVTWGSASAGSIGVLWQQLQNLTATFALQRVIYVVTIRPQLSSVVVVGPLYGRDITVHAGLNFIEGTSYSRSCAKSKGKSEKN